MVCHYPSGASKWNPIEHHLYGIIYLNLVAYLQIRRFGFLLCKNPKLILDDS
jgi:hypothetical protein